MDEKWIKNLVQADFSSGKWLSCNIEEVKEKAAREMLEFVPKLYQQAATAVEIFNLYNKKPMELKLLAIQDDESTPPHGFILLLGCIQLKVEQVNHQIDVTLTKIVSYRKIQKRIHSITPKIDPFGGLFWIMDRKSIMTYESVIKQLLMDICSVGYR